MNFSFDTLQDKLSFAKDYLSYEVLGNTVSQYIAAAVVFIVVFLGVWLAKRFLLSRLEALSKRTHFVYDDHIINFVKNIHGGFYALIALYFALQGLTLPNSISLIVETVFLIAVVMQVVMLTSSLSITVINKYMNKRDSSMPAVFAIVIRAIFWILGTLLILSNLGVDVTSLIAGLGVGGLAISLALQSTFEDLFSSVSIAVDKPFEVGDFIIVGDYMGVVKHIGLKTTRLTALGGEELVFTNQELTSAKIQNYKKMQRRRVVFSVGVTYDTTPDKLQQAKEILKSAVEAQEKIEFDRSHFHQFGDSALVFEVVYYVLTNDYNEYMDIQESINLQIHEQFAETGLDMAFPTQTLYLKKEE